MIGYTIAKGGKPMGSPPLSSFISLVLFHKFRDLDSDACRYIIRVWQDIHVVLHDVRPILFGAEESDGGTDDGLPFLQGMFSLNIRFIHESRMGDELACQTHPADAPQTFVGRIINGCGQEICRVSSHWVKREPLPDIASVNLIRHPQK